MATYTPTGEVEWVKFHDANSGADYFCNPVTNETTWTRPKNVKGEYSPTPPPAKASPAPIPTATVVTPVPQASPAPIPSAAVVTPVPKPAPAQIKKELWREVKGDTGTYYCNIQSQQTQWSKPTGAGIIWEHMVPAGWVKHTDPGSGANYYVETATSKSSWIHPSMIEDPKPTPVPIDIPAANVVPVGPTTPTAIPAANVVPVGPSTPTAIPATNVVPGPSTPATIPQTIATPSTPTSGGGAEVMQKKLEEAKKSAEPIVDNDGVPKLPNSVSSNISQFSMRGYAETHFATSSKGLFRRAIPLEVALKWTKDSLSAPLLKINDSKSAKVALTNWKNIQNYMGDRGSSRSSGQNIMAQNIVQTGIGYGELRDEVYCQLVKQTTENPNPESENRGWELLVLCCDYFPPSKDFEEYLKHYLSSHIVSDTDQGQRSLAASYCLRKVNQSSERGARAKGPTVKDLKAHKEAPSSKSLFSVSLDDVIAHQKHLFPDNLIPKIMEVLCESIINTGGPTSEGIFRVPGDAEEVNNLKIKLEGGDYDMSGINDPNVPSSLLKLWMRELEEPIIPKYLYKKCIGVSQDAEKCINLVTKLPSLNYNCLKYLIHFLQYMCHETIVAKTKMNEANIAMVFCPNLLRTDADNPMTILTSAPREQMFIKNLISHMKTD